MTSPNSALPSRNRRLCGDCEMWTAVGWGGKEGIRRVGRHRCITTLSPDVTQNELGALPSQTSHRLKLSSPGRLMKIIIIKTV